MFHGELSFPLGIKGLLIGLSDREGNTLTVWFGEPANEYIAEETGEEIILMKGREGKVIGFEKLNFASQTEDALRVAFETVTV